MKRADATDAYDARLQAKELIENFKAGSMATIQVVQAHVRGEVDMRQVAYVFRMAMCWIAISLSKFTEFWARYGALAPPELADEAKQILRVIRERKVDDFRNTVAAHMLDRGTRNPVPLNQVQEQVMRIWGGADPEAFLLWLEDPIDHSPHTVCATLRRFRAHLKANFELVEPQYVKEAPKLYLAEEEDD